jgi:hypothetical protein
MTLRISLLLLFSVYHAYILLTLFYIFVVLVVCIYSV